MEMHIQKTFTNEMTSWEVREKLKQDFMKFLDDNESLFCMHIFHSSLQWSNTLRPANILAHAACVPVDGVWIG
jgi:hypothetical protein